MTPQRLLHAIGCHVKSWYQLLDFRLICVKSHILVSFDRFVRKCICISLCDDVQHPVVLCELECWSWSITWKKERKIWHAGLEHMCPFPSTYHQSTTTTAISMAFTRASRLTSCPVSCLPPLHLCQKRSLGTNGTKGRLDTLSVIPLKVSKH